MCGICGIWDRRSPDDQALRHHLTAMVDTMAHRGPDDAGSFVQQGLGLGHRRLAVIDCSPTGHQPMASADGRYVVSGNGELYNYVELGDELRRSGYSFLGTSDTEVLVAGFQLWGVEKTLSRADGMFAVAVWDTVEHRLQLARDCFGEKPLYYGWAGQVFLFASELKAMHAHPDFAPSVDRGALCLYFRHNCIPTPHSIYEGIHKLPAGTVLTVHRGSRPGSMPDPVPFWSLAEVAEAGHHARGGMSLDDSVDQLDDTLSRAVRVRMRSDVPVGAFLSGGVDSSLIASLMQTHSRSKVRTFTIAFEDAAFDEAANAAAVARHLGTDHTEHTVTASEALAVIPSLATIYDEPFADSSQIPQTVLARLTRPHVTVALSGDGGDELFAGYNRYAFAGRFWHRLHAVPLPLRRAGASLLTAASPTRWDAVYRRIEPVVPASLRMRMPGTKLHKVAAVLPAATLEDAHRVLASHFQDPTHLVLGATEASSLLTTPSLWPSLDDPIERMLYLDTMTYLPDDILAKVDRATMAVNLETRLPFLDPAVAALAWRMPLDHKLRGGTGKWVLRRLLHRYVPAHLVERPKTGFGVPLGDWLRGPLRPWADDLLDTGRIRRQGYLDAEVVGRMWSEHRAGRREWPYELWDVLVFQAWLEAWSPANGGPSS